MQVCVWQLHPVMKHASATEEFYGGWCFSAPETLPNQLLRHSFWVCIYLSWLKTFPGLFGAFLLFLIFSFVMSIWVCILYLLSPIFFFQFLVESMLSILDHVEFVSSIWQSFWAFLPCFLLWRFRCWKTTARWHKPNRSSSEWTTGILVYHSFEWRLVNTTSTQ